MRSPEEMAEQFVSLVDCGPDGGRRVRLAAPGARPVLLGPHPNPAVARDEVAAVRLFVAAAIRAAAGRPPPDEPPAPIGRPLPSAGSPAVALA